jgi:hypothetical protein
MFDNATQKGVLGGCANADEKSPLTPLFQSGEFRAQNNAIDWE